MDERKMEANRVTRQERTKVVQSGIKNIHRANITRAKPIKKTVDGFASNELFGEICIRRAGEERTAS